MSVADPGWTHDSTGTPSSAWRADPRWSRVEDVTDLVDLAAVDRLVVLAAHPDDETLGAAGLCARAAAAGLAVDVVVVTPGEHSHPGSPSTTPSRLAELRRAESVAALALVAPGAVLTHLDVEDGTVADAAAQVTTRLVDLVGDGRSTLLVAPWRRDRHPDHEAAGRAAAAAARRTGATLLEYPIWFWHWGHPDDAPWDDLRALRLQVAERDVKARAVAAHASQVAPLSDRPGDETLLSPDFLAHFDGDEVFVVGPVEDHALDDLHRDGEEPWDVDRRWYEQRKRDLTLAALPRPRFARGLEIGCSTGALAERLAERCAGLVAVDASPAAVASARRRLAALGHVSVEVADLPTDWPEGDFDLVVLSEVGYFLSPVDLDLLRRRIGACLTPDGVVVLCHWQHPVQGWPLDGPAVHQRLLDGLGLPLAARYVDADVELLVLASPGSMPDPQR